MTRFLFAVHPTDYSLYAGFIHLGAGLACGFTGLAAGYAIGYVGDSVCSLIIVSDGCRRGLIIELEVCSSIRLRVQSVRIYGAHPHLRRSAGFVWVSRSLSAPVHKLSSSPQAYCCTHHELKSVRSKVLLNATLHYYLPF